MKTLTLLRHAKSGDDGLGGRDFDRRLNAKGLRAAAAMGRFLRDEAISFDAAIASPAVRVSETLAAVEASSGLRLQARPDKRLYLASVDDLIEAIQATPTAVTRLLIAGHNPGLERLVLRLVPDHDDDRVRGDVEEKYPTASLAEIALDVDRWTDVTAGTGRLARFVRPRDLDRALGPEEA